VCPAAKSCGCSLIEALTFDVYGTIIDWEESVKEPVLSILNERKSSAAQFMSIFRSKQLEFATNDTLMELPHVSFDEVTRKAFTSTCRTLQVSFNESNLRLFMDGWYHGKPFPDVTPNLTKLVGKLELIPFSNGDEKMLKEIVKGIPVKFDRVIGADMVGAYKPARKFYRKGIEILGISLDQVIHVCRAQFDACGAKAAGLKVIWVNRGEEAYDDLPYTPDMIIRDFSELTNALPH